jgi:hypothetical protein
MCTIKDPAAEKNDSNVECREEMQTNEVNRRSSNVYIYICTNIVHVHEAHSEQTTTEPGSGHVHCIGLDEDISCIMHE